MTGQEDGPVPHNRTQQSLVILWVSGPDELNVHRNQPGPVSGQPIQQLSVVLPLNWRPLTYLAQTTLVQLHDDDTRVRVMPPTKSKSLINSRVLEHNKRCGQLQCKSDDERQTCGRE